MFFGVKKNEQYDLISIDITIKNSNHEKIWVVTIDNKLSFEEHINNTCIQLSKNPVLPVE